MSEEDSPPKPDPMLVQASGLTTIIGVVGTLVGQLSESGHLNAAEFSKNLDAMLEPNEGSRRDKKMVSLIVEMMKKIALDAATPEKKA